MAKKLENFLTYTEYDPENKVTVSKNVITTDLYHPYSTTTRIYKNFGANFFYKNINIDFSFKTTDGALFHNHSPICVLSNIERHMEGLGVEDAFIGVTLCQTPTTYIFVYELSNFQGYSSSSINLSGNVLYYCNLSLNVTVGTYGTYYVNVYSDQEKQNLIGSITHALHRSDTYQYFYPLSSFNVGGNQTQSNEISNVSLNLPKTNRFLHQRKRKFDRRGNLREEI